ncbi:MAG TPA: ABC transporter permease [Chitinispirillaceae bacterium]|nr:ABC transporter permease [Chitinispirillaceae bacterium]
MKQFLMLFKSPMFVIGFTLFIATLLIALLGPVVYNITMDRVGMQYASPSGKFLFGCDDLGRDYVSLLIKGLQASLYVGFLAGIIATTLGTLLGIYGGFKGGLVDDILNMVTNLFIVIPSIVIIILISASFSEGRSLTLIAVIIGMTAWTWSARAVRAQSSALKSKDHISLAKMNGANTFAVITLHILPYLASYVFMVFILQVATGILTEAAISMIGLGPLDTVSLGTILNQAKNNGALGDGIWWAFMPATVIITMVVFALYLINTSAEGVFNPRLRK